MVRKVTGMDQAGNKQISRNDQKPKAVSQFTSSIDLVAEPIFDVSLEG